MLADHSWAPMAADPYAGEVSKELLHRALRHARRKRIQFARSVATSKMADQQAACASLVKDSTESQYINTYTYNTMQCKSVQ